jgi:hypothetical protein
LAAFDIEGVLDPIERAVPAPQIKIILQRRAWRQVFRDRPPLATGAQDVDQAVDDLARIHRSLVAAALGWWNMRLDQRPLLVAQVRGIAQAAAIIASAVFLRPDRRRLPKESGRPLESQMTQPIQYVPGHTLWHNEIHFLRWLRHNSGPMR